MSFDKSLLLSNLCCVLTVRHVDVTCFQGELHLGIMGKARKTTFSFYIFSELAPTSIEKNETSQLLLSAYSAALGSVYIMKDVVYAPYAAARKDP